MKTMMGVASKQLNIEPKRTMLWTPGSGPGQEKKPILTLCGAYEERPAVNAKTVRNEPQKTRPRMRQRRWLMAIGIVAATAWVAIMSAALVKVHARGIANQQKTAVLTAATSPTPTTPPAQVSPSPSASTAPVASNSPIGYPRASMRITSTPAGAEVFLDGKIVGEAPVTVRATALITASLEVRKAGYQTVRKSVVPGVGTVSMVHVALKPSAAPREWLSMEEVFGPARKERRN